MPRFASFRYRSLAAVLLGAILLGSSPLAGAANDGDTRVRRPRNPARPFAIRHPLPFKFGEKLLFHVKFSRFPISATVGDLTFQVTQPSESEQHVKFQVDAVSRGALVSMFGVKVNDTLTTLADRNDLFVYSTIKNLSEGDYRRYKEAVYSRQDRKVRYRVRNPLEPNEKPSVNESEAPAWVQDIVSAFYFARTRKLKNVGREVGFVINDEGQSYHIGIALLGRERIKTDLGTLDTLKVDVRIFNGRYIRKEGELHVWLTDDARRIPVKAKLKIPAGTVSFDLDDFVEGTKTIERTQAPNLDDEDDEGEDEVAEVGAVSAAPIRRIYP